ncbi:HD family phosphohydrolase [uncultured Clostridium sp.]|uniref:HD family phosphohydrolase n=1 Tax=uncultured Clostridium sp. TaxID=59620 RepID=UPI002610F99C|nr:HD family phosphohydrolase [uncultured Clostridium sp.]
MEETKTKNKYEILDLFLNNNSDLIYISDVETHEIIYVNNNIEEMFKEQKLIGEKCHKVFQNLDKLCYFCTNEKIKDDISGNFYESEFYNEKLNKKFKLKDKMIDWFDGRRVRLEIASSLSEEVINLDLSRVINYENALEDILNDFEKGVDFTKLVEKVLYLIGEYTGASRVYIFNIDLFQDYISNVYEWCAKDVTPQIENLKCIPCSSIPWWMDKLLKDEHIFIPDVEKMPEEAINEQKILENQEIKSAIVIPLKVFDQLYGFIGIDNVLEESIWNENEVETLMSFVNVISKIMESNYKYKDSEEITQKYNTIFDATVKPTIIVNEWRKIIIYNNELAEFLEIEENINGTLIDKYIEEIDLESSNNKEFTVLVNGKEKNIVVTIKKLTNINQYVITLFDVTERKNAEKELRELGYKDKLTNLYNRNKYIEDIAEIGEKGIGNIGIVISDIDGLKFINDSLGHDFGDEVIRKFARILKDYDNEETLVYRFGGDEFIIIIKGVTKEKIIEISEDIRNKISLANEYGEEKYISASIGIAYGESKGINELLREADVNMYREKVKNNRCVIDEIVKGFEKALETKDYGMLNHGTRMEEYALLIAEKLNLSSRRKDRLKLLCKFHDIGKIAIENNILFKPGKLTFEEFNIVKQHSEIGYRIARNSSLLETISDFILKHHERFDGNGYPLGIKGKEIPLECRIVALVDTFDVIINERPYKKAATLDVAIEEIKRCMGTQFDPRIAKIFIEILEKEKKLQSLDIKRKKLS